MSARFDAIIVGAGQAGPALAGRLTSAGMTVAVVERNLFGGTCVNTGCTPTKAMVASAYAAHLARRAADYGVHVPAGVSVDFAAVMARKDAISGKSRDGVESWLRGMERCSVHQGHARFVSPREIRVGEELLAADRIFLNVGGRALTPDMPGLGDIAHLTNSSILRLQRLPRRLVVIGGSYIGLEFAQMFRRFGSEVAVIEKGPRLASREDEDVSDAITGVLEREGVEVRLGAECIRFERRGDEAAVGLDCASGATEIVGDQVLLAIGRRPNTDDLDVANAGIELDDRGYVKVDDELRTTAPNVWALGDCNGRGAFTHTAYNDFEIVAANLLDGASRRLSDRIPAYALYTDPPLGRVGLTEAQARATGRAIRVGKRPMTRVARAVEKGETDGFMKIVLDAESEEILGAAILGVGGDEAIHGVLDAMNLGARCSELERAVPIHPTVSELIPTIIQEALP